MIKKNNGYFGRIEIVIDKIKFQYGLLLSIFALSICILFQCSVKIG